MAARRPWRTRLAAGGAGLAINVGLLALLTLERRTPPMAEPPAVVVALEPRASPPERRRSPPARRAGAPASTPPRLEAPPDVAPLVLPAAPPGNDLSSTVEPRWRVGGGEYLDPETARRARRAWEAAEDRRYKRACLGQSDEHMTPEEKDACWDAWGGNALLSGPGGSRPGRRYPGPATTSPRPGSG